MKTHKPRISLDLQIACQACNLPSMTLFKQWSTAALGKHASGAQLCIRLVDAAESAELNQHYRNKPSATNVLSFPFEAPEGLQVAQGYLGDIVICADVVAQEASEQQKPELAHWAHMTIHGVLHLLGYDHVEDAQAVEMEALETQLLSEFGFANPYGD
jgi:probable rRNA maturation factor